MPVLADRGRSLAAVNLQSSRRAPTQDSRYDYCACILRSLNLEEGKAEEDTFFREWGDSLALEGEYLTE